MQLQRLGLNFTTDPETGCLVEKKKLSGFGICDGDPAFISQELKLGDFHRYLPVTKNKTRGTKPYYILFELF